MAGNGKRQGYAFSHPRLGQYFWEKLSGEERRALEKRFVDWGLECVERLCRGELTPRDISPYLVRALGGHLARIQARPEQWLSLVHGAWAAAGEALEGAHGLFLHDVMRAWRACAAADREATARGEPAPYLGGEVRCALIEASLHSLAENIPPVLLAALVEKGIWTPAQGLAYASQVPDPRQRSQAIRELAPHLRLDLLGQALAATREIENEDWRAEVLAALAPRLAELRYPQEALTAAREIENEDRRAEVLAALAPHLAELGYPQEALTAAREIENENRRAEALAALAPRLPPDQHSQVLAEALATARKIRNENRRAEALAALAPRLPPDQHSQVLAEALATARKIRNEYWRAEVLAALAPRLAELGYPQEALTTAREIENEYWRAKALAALIPHLSLNLLGQALATARGIRDPFARAEVLVVLAPRLAELGIPKKP